MASPNDVEPEDVVDDEPTEPLSWWVTVVLAALSVAFLAGGLILLVQPVEATTKTERCLPSATPRVSCGGRSGVALDSVTVERKDDRPAAVITALLGLGAVLLIPALTRGDYALALSGTDLKRGALRRKLEQRKQELNSAAEELAMVAATVPEARDALDSEESRRRLGRMPNLQVRLTNERVLRALEERLAPDYSWRRQYRADGGRTFVIEKPPWGEVGLIVVTDYTYSVWAELRGLVVRRDDAPPRVGMLVERSGASRILTEDVASIAEAEVMYDDVRFRLRWPNVEEAMQEYRRLLDHFTRTIQ